MLEKHHIKNTPGRIAILEILQKAKKPVDIQFIIEELDKKQASIDRATVFRIINVFTEQGIVHKLEFSEGKARYELTSLPHHHHVICVNCGIVKDIEDCDVDDLEKKISKNLEFEIQTHRLEFFGLCKKCKN